jgi:broad specificity polyphosphatase/5'/3'-nucleotidase SurE
MKKMILTLSLMGFISMGAMAQQRGGERPSPEERATRMTERMAEKLSLSVDQKMQILVINLENAKNQETKQLERTQQSDARKAVMETRKEELRAQDEKIKAVLTEAQLVKWEEVKEDIRDRRGGPGGDSSNGGDNSRKRRGGGNR